MARGGCQFIFSIGYGSAILSYDGNLAEGLSVRDSLFVARNGVAQFQADPPVWFANGGFEAHDGHRLQFRALTCRPAD